MMHLLSIYNVTGAKHTIFLIVTIGKYFWPKIIDNYIILEGLSDLPIAA